MKNIWHLFIFFQLSAGCVQKEVLQKNFDAHLNAENCQAALENIPNENKINKVLSLTKVGTGTLISYTAVGAGAGVDVLIDAVKVAIVIVPIAILSSKGSLVPIPMGSGGKSTQNDFFDFSKMPVMHYADNKTKDLRCPPIDEISQNMRRVAQCYSTQAPDGKNKSRKLLLSVLSNDYFFDCISSAEKKAFFADLKIYEGR